jgi:serine protease AprX
MLDEPPVPLLLAALLLAAPLTGCVDALPLSDGAVGQTWPREVTAVDKVQSERGLSGNDVKVAVVDTGIAAGHPEFEGVDIVAWKDYVRGRSEPYDNNGHGTHVAGIVAAQGRLQTLTSGFRLQGAAHGVDLVITKAIGADGTGDGSDVRKAIDFSRQNGADIIVLSLGGGSFPVLGSETEQAVQRAIDAGVYVVSAAGNTPQGEDSCDGVASPGNVKRVVTVGAITEDKTVADFSCRGNDNDPNQLGTGGRSDPHKKPEVVAPGASILSTWTGVTSSGPCDSREYCQASGTSQAVPFVAGVLAMILEENPELERQGPSKIDFVKQRIMTSSEQIGPLEGGSSSEHHDAYGYGLIRADRLLDDIG